MSASLLYRAFCVRGYRYKSTRFEKGEIVFRIEAPRESLRCPVCGCGHVHVIERFRRRWRAVPIGHRTVWIEMEIPRVECQQCGRRRRVPVAFAEPKVQRTRAFERYVGELLCFMTVQDISLHLGVSWDTVNAIQKKRLNKTFGRPKLKHLQRIAIDEIHVGKRHRFVTLVVDLDSGAVVFVGRGRRADTLKPFWKRLRSSGAKVRAVATDMAPGYVSAVRKNLPRARLVLDRFHVVKLLNEKLTKLRRELYREANDGLFKQALKGTRWLLLKNFENLDETRNEHDRLAEALELNEPLATAYYLKEELRAFWERPDRSSAGRFLTSWCRRAEASGIRQIKQFAKTLRSHRQALLAWYSDPISTGPLEGLNNRIKLMQRRAYGYRDFELFKLRILALHTTRFELIG